MSFFGYINTPLDAAILITCVIEENGLVTPVTQRLVDREREKICSGSVYVFSEKKSGMRRWTDGMRWSKSRVEGQFLVYRRLALENPPPQKRRRTNDSDSDDERKKVAISLGDDVLCKKTFSISLHGDVTHVVCYYLKDDVLSGKLKCPSSMDKFSHVVVPGNYLDPQNFRLHPKGVTAGTPQRSAPTKPYASPVSINGYRPDTPVSSERKYVVVHCFEESQTMQIHLPEKLLDFRNMVNHAFNLKSMENFRLTIGSDYEISDQATYEEIRNGDLIQVKTWLGKSEKMDSPTLAALTLTQLGVPQKDRDGVVWLVDSRGMTSATASVI